MERICYPQVISRNGNRRRLNCDCGREWKQEKIFTIEPGVHRETEGRLNAKMLVHSVFQLVGAGLKGHPQPPNRNYNFLMGLL